MLWPECMSVFCVLYVCPVPAEATEAADPLGLELGWLGAAVWVLEIDPKSSGRAASTLSYQAIPLASVVSLIQQ
jgi:hypothetical protein